MTRRLYFVLLLLCLVCPSASADQDSWPAIERQLAADRVVPASALERLIERNQDFELLHPAETNDRIPVPLWLRVLWRKQHPGMRYNPGDPTGGYPLALKEVHEWMLSHQDLLPGVPEPDVAPPLEKVSGGANLRISGASLSPRSESDIRVNYWDTSKIIAGSNNIGGSGSQAQFYSTDGGRTWGQTLLPRVTGDSFHTDPTVDWTSDGTAWATTIGVTSTTSALRMRLYRSTDHGATWIYDSTFSGNQTDADKQMVWIDHSAASPHRDSIYAIWHNGPPVYMNRKRFGQPWGSPIKVSGAETTGTGIGGDVKTNSAGDVFGLWPDTGSRKIYLVRSTNGGASYTRPASIASTFAGYDIGVPAQNARRVLIYVSAGAYRTAAKNLVYAAWTDLSGAAGCRSVDNEPGASAASACKTRIWFSRSTNGGLTWSAKRMINHQASKNDQLNQALAVDETTGAIAIIYYDTVGDPTRKKTHIWYQSSFDDGVTWSAPFRVTTAQSSVVGAGADNNQYGDYNSLTGYAGTFFPVWTDRRNGQREEIWTAALVDPVQGGGGSCTNTALFSEGFEARSGLANWSRGSFVSGGSTTDWRGVQTCPARTGGKVFRFGGAGCSNHYGNGRFAFVQPGGEPGIAIPAGATGTRLSFWHRRRFEPGADGGLLALSLDGGSYTTVPASAIASGATYNGTVDAACPPAGAAGLRIFTGAQNSFVQTVVNLDAACNAVTGGTGGCAGRSVRIAFASVTDCSITEQGWFLDDVSVTACVP